MDLVVLIIGIVALILIVWWLTSLFSSQITSPNKFPQPVSFTDMVNNFNSFPKGLWMTCNVRDLNDALKNSPFHYTVIESNGKIFYSNRDTNNHNLINTFEVTMSVVTGEGFVVRDGCRNAAIRVCNWLPEYRVVHISSPV